MLAFSTTIFLSAFLLFIVQPMLAKKLLPWFGGSASVWLSIVLFFQIILLLGNSYAYFLTKIKRFSYQVTIHLSLLGLSLLFIPVMPAEALASLPLWPPIAIFILLSATVILPITMISTSSPLLQHWYCQSYQSDFPHRFYGLSNVGSLLGLLAFPLLLEPFFGLNFQLSMWSSMYGLFVLSSGICLWVITQKSKHPKPQTAWIDTDAQTKPPRKHLIAWVIFTAFSCTLLLCSTQIMMQSVAGFPLLWLIPLTWYLLSFIVTFTYPNSYYRPLWIGLYFIATVSLLGLRSHHQLTFLIQILLYSLSIFSGCMICHGELIRLKPHKNYLTLYYLMIGCGGVLGSLFVNILAPILFNDWWDYYLVLFSIFALAGYQVPKNNTKFFTLFWLTGMGIILLLLIYQLHDTRHDLIIKHRNFFGKSEIIEKFTNTTSHQRVLRNGNIIHGQQYIDPSQRKMATTYFSQDSGVGSAITFLRQQSMAEPTLRIGVIGLGTGTIATLGKPGDFIRFYEIDKDMEKIAKKYFSYLSESQASTEIVIGDGRVCLHNAIKNQQNEHYDLLIIDAFSGDSIPLHLLTKEALITYLSHLAPKGILAFHISSRYLALYPPLQALADDLKLQAYIARNEAHQQYWIFSSEWIIMSRQSDIGLFLYQQGGLAFDPQRTNTIWTDDKHYLLSAIRW